MKHTILASALLAGLGLCAFSLPSAALPMNATGVTASDGGDLVQVRMTRREMRRHRMMRQHRMRQGSASRGNASMPSRGASGQQYGGTSGGPRR
ncbi:hypothetical protein [Methylobacterium sp. WCS2018Hpa-22]|uniref:hypothetical protein n=1 Tax=Methylobacterium sp. WCS2018Hpa-22 TaxID=3073633 RepID=UPI00288C0415|nr:hypothetical protein [Methylobacterium sp. WCS2018Hpa-22]